MNDIDKIGLLADLVNLSCVLEHHDNINHEAIDYIVCPVGIKTEIQGLLTLPICELCVEALQNGEWVLLYCLECMSSQWILRELAKLQYNCKIIWLKGCPKCSQKIF